MRTQIKLLFIGLLLQLSTDVISQNLVPNPDFELYSTCPTSYSTLSLTLNWTAPTQGTSDFFDTCATPFSNVDIPINWFGTQNTYNGGGYVGLFAFYKWFYSYREYIQAKLTSPLVANQTYYVSFWVSLSDSSQYATDDLGIYFSQNQVSANHDSTLIFTPQIANPQNQFLTNKNSWVKISGSFIAIGGEEYLTIGNFKNDISTDTIIASLPHKIYGDIESCYYYIDGICVSTNAMYCNVDDETTGISKLDRKKELIYYNKPNIIITKEGNYKINFYNLYGVSIKEEILQGSQSIDVSALETGWYIVVIKSNESIIRKKIYISN